MVDRAVIEELKMRNHIEDVISSYVRLTRAGQNLKGLCPFHSEKTPSFTVFPKEDSFYCFGCGAGGDIVTFVMKAENLSYPDALQFLAQRAGMTLPEDSAYKQESGLNRSDVISMNRYAAKYYFERLNDPNTPQGLEYLTEKRGFSMPLIRHFGMGYAPDSSFGLRDYLKRKGYTDEQMEKGYLVRKSSDGKRYYDVFRNRVMVPILDAGGNIIAFGGRLLTDGQPKYLNSSDTPAFRKSKTLFALNFAKEFCSERMILCEGYMDVIALHGAGFKNAVATLGTAITPDHARMMSRYTKSVVICYDADAAGQNAADKAFRMLSEVGLETKILKVEDAKDPDEYIKKSGAEAFSRLLEGSKTRFEFKFGQILAKYDLTSMDARIKAANETTDLILQFSSKVEREMYIAAASKKLDVSVESLRSEIERRQRSKDRKSQTAQSVEILRRAEGYTDRINPQTVGNVAAVRAEETILGLMLLREEIAEKAVKENAVEESDFVTDFNRRVFSFIKKVIIEGQFPDVSFFSEEFNADEVGRIVKMRLDRMKLGENGYPVLLECVKKLKENKKRQNTTEDIEEILRRKREKNGK